MSTSPISGNSTPDLSYIDSPSYQNLDVSIKDMLSSALSTDELNQLFPSSPTLPSPEVTLDEFFNIMITNARDYQKQLELNEQVDQDTRRIASRLISVLAGTLAEKFANKIAALFNVTITTFDTTVALNNYIEQLKSYVDNQNIQIDNLNAGNATEYANITTVIAAYTAYVNTIKASPINAVETPAGSGNYRINYPTTGNDSQKATEMQNRINAYNAAANTLNSAINNFNTNLNARRAQLDAYNNTASNYSNLISPSVNPLAAILNIFNTYDLNDPSVTNVPSASRRPSSGAAITAYPNITTLAPLLTYSSSNTNFYTVSSSNPQTSTPWIQAVNSGGVASLNLPSISYDPSPGFAFAAEIQDFLYERDVKPFDLIIDLTFFGVSADQARSLFIPVTETAIDPLLNTKKIVKKILPDTDSQITDGTADDISSGSPESILETQGIKHVQNILGRFIVKQTIEQLNLDLSAQQKELFANQILILSSALISNVSSEALLPSLGPISELLPKLPSNSPVFSLLFAVSFANRAQEKVQGVTVDALQEFINNSPDLQGIDLNTSQLEQLATTINLGLLLVSAKLLTAVLGLPGLLPQLLGGLSPELLAQVKELATTENNQGLEDLQAKILQKFLDQGLGLEEAQFLANFGVSLVAKGLTLAPSATIVSRDTVQVDLLKNSLTAELVLSGLDLTKATNTANQIIEKVLNKGPLPLEQFTNAIELNLRRLDIKENKADLASQLLVIPTELPTLSQPVIPPISSNSNTSNNNLDLLSIDVNSYTSPLTSTPSPTVTSSPTTSYTPSSNNNVNVNVNVGSTSTTNTISPDIVPNVSTTPSSPIGLNVTSTTNNNVTPITSTDSTTDIADSTGTVTNTPDTPRPTPPLSEAQIIQIIEKRTLELLVPQLGAELARLVSAELAKTLFGTPNPDYADKADLKAPLSLVNTIKNQIYHLNKENNKEYAENIAATFKETIKDSVQLNAFLEKLMDPANLFIYSFSSGIMYGGHEPANWKKSIDILI